VRSKFPDNFKECSEFIRHKTTLIFPGLLREKGVRMEKMIQREGEFMVTRAAGYHSGFNFGFNIAEAVNFALSRWLDVVKKAKSCKCANDSVRINMGYFLNNILLPPSGEEAKGNEVEEVIRRHRSKWQREKEQIDQQEEKQRRKQLKLLTSKGIKKKEKEPGFKRKSGNNRKH